MSSCSWFGEGNLRDFWTTFQGWFVIPRAWTACIGFSSVVIRLYTIDRVLWLNHSTVSVLLHGSIRNASHKCSNGTIKELDIKNYFDRLSASATMSNKFAIWAFSVFPMTSSHSTPSPTCSKTAYTPGTKHLCLIWNDFRYKSSWPFWTRVDRSFAFESCIADIIGQVIGSLFSVQRNFWWFLCLTCFLSLATVPLAGPQCPVVIQRRF